MLPLNTYAPDFALPDNEGELHSLKDYRGTPVILIFYPKDNSYVCTMQLNAYSTQYEKFTERGARILAISTDDVDVHKTFQIRCSFPFPLLADSRKAVSRAYQALNFLGMSQRAVYIIDREGIIRFAQKTLPFRYLTLDVLLKAIPA
jgi:thioredoxin-dependent peroxiredoxin